MDKARIKELEQRDCKREMATLLEKYLGAFAEVGDAVAAMHRHINDHVQHQHDMRHMR